MSSQIRDLPGPIPRGGRRPTPLLAHLAAPSGLDYIAGFTALCGVNLEMRRAGHTVPLLLRKAVLERGLGNFAACLAAATDATAMDPESAEAFHEVGWANLMLALARAGAVTGCPSTTAACKSETVDTFLSRATAAFRENARLNQADQEAAADVAVLERIASGCLGQGTLVVALRHLVAG